MKLLDSKPLGIEPSGASMRRFGTERWIACNTSFIVSCSVDLPVWSTITAAVDGSAYWGFIQPETPEWGVP